MTEPSTCDPFESIPTSQTVETSCLAAPNSVGPSLLEERVALVKFALEREEDAAATIFRLSYQIEPGTELGNMARRYAIEIREFTARLGKMLPQGYSAMGSEGDIGRVSESIIQSLTPGSATTFLISFLIQHAETNVDILQSAGAKLGSREMDMLWRKADRERRKLAGWVREIECQLEARREGQRPDPKLSATQGRWQQLGVPM